MIIKKIHISDFGKLSDIVITPSKKFNIIFAPNESGKTTLLEFIKFIFYGTRQKKTKNELALKEKYMPWSGMPMSGSIEFEYGGKNYYIHRSEGARNGSKIFEIKNADTGEKCVGIDNPGEYFFSVDEKVFSDVFFARDSSVLFEPDESISSAVYGENETDSSYNRVRSIIEEELLDLTSTKRSGSELTLVNKEISEVSEEKLNIEKKIHEINHKLSVIEKEKEKLEQQSVLLKCEYDDAIKRKSTTEITDFREKLKKEYENLKDLKSKSDKIQKGIYDKYSNKKKNIFSAVWIVCFAILLATIISGFLFEKLILTLVGTFGILLGAVIIKLKRKPSVDMELFNTIKTQIELCENRISDYKKELFVKDGEMSDYEAYVMSQSGETNIFTNDEIDDIINKIHECEISINVKQSQIQSLNEMKNDLNLDIEDCIRKIKESNLKLERIKEKQSVYETALHILDSAFSHLRDYYAPRISLNAFEIFKKVCKEEYKALVADDKFEISLNFRNEMKSIKSFSRSTRDIAGLSVRMAICDSISGTNQLPMFFDDVLSSFDDKRCFDMMERMENISDDRQIFLCTCRSRETELHNDWKDVEVIRL